MHDLISQLREDRLVQALSALLSALFAQLFGMADNVFWAFVTLMVLDLVARLYKQSVKAGGFWRAIKTGKISSEVMRAKTTRKVVSYAIILAGGTQVARVLPATITVADLPLPEMVRLALFSWVSLTELLSIIETLAEADGEEAIRELHQTLSRHSTGGLLDRVLGRLLGSPARQQDKEASSGQ